MKNILIYCLTFIFPYLLQAQEHKDIKILSKEEVSKRLLPQFSPLAFMPVTEVNLKHIKEEREKQGKLEIPKISNADSVDILYKKIPGLNAGDPEIPIRIYKPKTSEKTPIFLWFHGGGYVYGSLNWDHQNCASIAVRSNVLVISVDYRFAPEHKYPAAVHDAYASFLWSIKNAPQLNADPSLVGVGGGSAGAGIAGSLVLMNREKKGPEIKLQALFFPPGNIDTTSVSMRELWEIPGVKGADIPILLAYYFGDEYKNNLPKNAILGEIEDYRNLPATYLATCGVDPLRDAGLDIGIKLIEAGVPVELHNFPGYPHGMLPERVFPELYHFLKTYYYLDHSLNKNTLAKSQD